VRDLAGVVEVIIFAEGEAAVQDDVFIWIEGIGIDEQRRMMIGWKGGFADSDGFLIPGEREFSGNLANEFVAVWVAKEDEVVRGDICIGDLGIVFLARFTAELAAPLLGSMRQFALDPLTNRFDQRFAGGAADSTGT